ncbi:S49 family peptidase [Teichococcus oryzae]|uniref:S49 family peptidase n=1 Tax=Teichococcus oryzae TaxID=1608942 RepID=A0A5B2TII3_9PROT|nr:S49 family peptidase [Pseudoroseomonas oryzae]KAA2214292.1 S49 family peptidase [Pseudoroseomonas oryzae]
MQIPFLNRPPVVAVVRLSGVIAARGGLGPAPAGLNIDGIGPVLERAFALKRLAGVVLAINSPGGSPVQSSLIAGRIRQLADKNKVPVIACCEDAAASGGYWLACAADEVIADPSSIVGSIGVISAGFGVEGLAAKLGVERRLTTAGGQKSFLDPFRPVEPWQQERLEELLGALHAEFKGWVRDRRGSRLKAPEEALFTGRFWTGREALALGLVDGLGDARGEIRRRFGEKARIVPLGQRRPPLPLRLLRGAMAEGLAVAEERMAWARLGL